MRNVTVARRYAKALYELAVETKTLEDVLQGMKNICSALQTMPDLGRILFNPLVKPELKLELIKTVTSNKLILKFTALLARRKRLDLITVVYEQLSEMGDEALGIRRAIIKTAVSLTDAQKRMIEADLAKSLGSRVIGQFQVARELIGGVWVKLGDHVLDATIKGRIEDFRHVLVNSAN